MQDLASPDTQRPVKLDPRFSAGSYSKGGIPTIRTTDMDFNGSITLKDAPCVSPSKNELEKFMLEDGDLLITRTGATIGKAFRGELVPQDPNDEPASVLLERIREDRANQQPDSPRRGKRIIRRQES